MLFSVIIPVYNVAPYLRECLDSIVAAVKNFGKPVELICIDDGSTDGSGAILDTYNPTTTLIDYKIQHQPNAGVSVARNNGLAIACGEYICFVDADDTVHVNWLVKYASVLDETCASLVRMGLRNCETENADYIVYEGTQLESWAWKELAQNGYNWRYTVRRCIAQEARFPKGVTYCEDSLFTMQLIPYLDIAVQMSGSYYNYRIRSGSAMRQKYSSNERLLFLNALLGIAESQRDFDKVVVSRSAIGNVLVWAGNPADIEHIGQIRQLLSEFVSKGIVDASCIPLLDKISYVLFKKTGWIWPVKMWNCVIRWCIWCAHRFFGIASL